MNTRYKTDYYTGTLGDTLTAGNLTITAGVRYDSSRGKNLPSYGAGNPMFPDLLPAVTYPGDHRQPLHVQELAAARFGDLRIGKERNTLAARLVRHDSRTSWASSSSS